jgi:uncharacterized integral membrane protein
VSSVTVSRVKLPTRLQGRPEQGIYVVVGVLAVVVLFLVGFVVKNDRSVRVDFVVFSAGSSLIWVILISLFLGIVIGILVATLSPLGRGRRATSTPGPGARAPQSDDPLVR